MVEVYTRPACPVCEAGLDLVHRARRVHGFALVEKSILDDPECFARYRYRVPVVCVDGIERLALGFSQEELEAALTEPRPGRAKPRE